MPFGFFCPEASDIWSLGSDTTSFQHVGLIKYLGCEGEHVYTRPAPEKIKADELVRFRFGRCPRCEGIEGTCPLCGECFSNAFVVCPHCRSCQVFRGSQTWLPPADCGASYYFTLMFNIPGAGSSPSIPRPKLCELKFWNPLFRFPRFWRPTSIQVRSGSRSIMYDEWIVDERARDDMLTQFLFDI